jgi:hypothetical protein
MEGYTSNKYSVPNFFDRIRFVQGDTDRNYKNSEGTLLDMSGQYGYCLGGNLKCTGGSTLVEIKDSYSFGKTYSSLCSDDSKPICENNYYGSYTDASMANNINIDDFIIGTKGSYGGINIMDKLNFQGFVGPYNEKNPTGKSNYYPFTTDSSSNKYFQYKYYDATGALKQVSNQLSKCKLVNKNDTIICDDYFYTLGKKNDSSGDSGDSSGNDSDDDDGKTSDDSNDDDIKGFDSDEGNYSSVDDSCGSGIKCIADFGTNIGDNLCCGQTGVLQNTKYVCPSNAPKCSNFKCGSNFGTCSA